jgi:putative DNA primase/helicase
MAFVVGKDPQDENRRVVASTKNNLAMPPASLMYQLEEADTGSVRVDWLGQSEVSASQLLATPRDEEQADARGEAVEFLNDVLCDGPVAASQVKEESEDAGITDITLRRAKKSIGILAYRENVAGDKRGSGRWMWKLPMVELLTDDVQGAQGVLKENDERLEHGGESHTRESALDKPNVQDDHSNVQDAHHVQGAQDEHLEQEITRAPAEAPLSAEQWEDV